MYKDARLPQIAHLLPSPEYYICKVSLLPLLTLSTANCPKVHMKITFQIIITLLIGLHINWIIDSRCPGIATFI